MALVSAVAGQDPPLTTVTTNETKTSKVLRKLAQTELGLQLALN